MFNKLKIVPSAKNLGQFAELSLFYDKLYFEFSENFYNAIRKSPKPEKFIEFICENKENFHPYYNCNTIYTHHISPNSSGEATVSFHIGGYSDVGDVDFIEHYATKKLWGENTDTFVKMIEFKKTDHSLLDIVFHDLQNYELIEYVSHKASIDFKLIKKNLYFFRTDKGIFIRFKKIPHVKVGDSLTEYVNSLLLFDERSHTDFDFVSDRMKQNLFSDKCELFLKEKQILEFNELVLNDTLSIRECINSKKRTLEDFMTLYRKSKKFKSWLADLGSDSKLISEYYNETIREQWNEKLPAKALRWLMFTSAGMSLDALGMGMIGTISGITVGAFDTFILDKLIKGWRPNQFVDKEYRPFLNA